MENLLGLPALGLRSRWSRPPSTTPEMLNLCSNGVRGSTLLLRPTTLVRPHSASIASDLSEGCMVNNPALSRGAASTPTTLTKVEKVVKSYPRLLRCSVEKTLIPKIRVLEDFGICGSELISVIASNPSLLKCVSRDSFLAKLDFLKSILGSVENARNAVKEGKWILYVSLTNILQPNFESLKSYGISDGRLQKFLVKHHRYLCINPKRLQENLVRVEQVLGIPRESAMFLYGFKAMASVSKRGLELKFEMFKRYGWSESDVLAMASFSKRGLELKFEMFKRYGWSESDVLVMAKRMPQCLLTSEAKLKTSMGFFVNKLGYEIGYLAERPTLLSFSMEGRILPRYAVMQVLQERNLLRRNPSIYTYLNRTEFRFLDAYVLPFKDELPELYEAYTGKKSVDSSVQEGKQYGSLQDSCISSRRAS
ncbi:hypothetical protein Dimus_023830 [Dionaea muscipula]